MSDADTNSCAIGYASSRTGALGVADWLCLAAAPTFAIMALITGMSGQGQMNMPCATMHDASPLSGMAVMYLLMSAFHLAAWLKLLSRLRRS